MVEFSEPPRLFEAQSGAPAELSQLFRGGQRDLPSEAELDRLAERLGPVLGPEGSPAPTPRPRWVRAAKLSAVASAIVGLGVLAYVVTHRPAPTAPAPSAVLPNPAPMVTPAQPPQTEPSASASANESPSAAPASPTAANRTGNGRVRSTSEADLLERARRALATDPARALALARQHQAQFPNGVLKQEREVIAIEALRRAGRSQEASDRAGRFEKEYPDSAHRRAVETGLAK